MQRDANQANLITRNSSKSNESQRIMLFDLSVGGHHPDYLQHLIQHWEFSSAYIYIVVLPKFIEQHGNVVDLAQQKSDRLKFVPISESEASALVNRSNVLKRKYLAFQKWSLMVKYAKQLEATQVLLMYFDIYQLPILVANKLPCPVSGIYFRSRFHYETFNQHLSWREKLNLWREKIYLRTVLHQARLNKLFCLDPFVVKHIQQWQTTAEAVVLPDPVVTNFDRSLDSGEVRTDLKIEGDRLVFLLFGALDERKGLHKVLEAITLLPQNLSSQVCLLLGGRISQRDKQQAYAKFEQLALNSNVQLIVEDRFLPESEIQRYFQAADIILAPYQRHVGMSGILVRAAAVQKPVLSSDYGLMGEVTRRYQLGLTVDSTVSQEIALGMSHFINNPSQKSPVKMRAYAERNSADKFAEVIFKNLVV